MLEAKKANELPVVLQLNDVSKFSFPDFRDAFLDFRYDTGLIFRDKAYIMYPSSRKRPGSSKGIKTACRITQQAVFQCLYYFFP